MSLPDLSTIKDRRAVLGISQRQIAKEIGVSSAMMNQVENGVCYPSWVTAVRIFDLLDRLENNSSSENVILRLKELGVIN